MLVGLARLRLHPKRGALRRRELVGARVAGHGGSVAETISAWCVRGAGGQQRRPDGGLIGRVDLDGCGSVQRLGMGYLRRRPGSSPCARDAPQLSWSEWERLSYARARSERPQLPARPLLQSRSALTRSERAVSVQPAHPPPVSDTLRSYQTLEDRHFRAAELRSRRDSRPRGCAGPHRAYIGPLVSSWQL